MGIFIWGGGGCSPSKQLFGGRPPPPPTSKRLVRCTAIDNWHVLLIHNIQLQVEGGRLLEHGAHADGRPLHEGAAVQQWPLHHPLFVRPVAVDVGKLGSPFFGYECGRLPCGTRGGFCLLRICLDCCILELLIRFTVKSRLEKAVCKRCKRRVLVSARQSIAITALCSAFR